MSILKKCFVLLASSGVARGGATGAPVLSKQKNFVHSLSRNSLSKVANSDSDVAYQ